ncbi:MAG TPA: serine/threonine-protein kinase [Gemmataceae bacterium]|nr:serine/threonine-protein kinase [Gemmataceae bacterium]
MVGRVFLGRYETIRLLGEGGMGRVYLARQLDLGRQVVVKVMHDQIAGDPKFCERFQRETLLMARFQHPYAVTLYDASLNDPQGPCIVMEYIKGMTLDVLLSRNNRLSPVRVGRLLGQICEVLQAAHTEGIIHRDLKPANLMVVDPDTPYERIKVMDFGLAKLVAGENIRTITVTNTEFAVGTPGYMCPEQARGDEMDHRGDLYSIGVILYELLTGKLPFAGRSTMDILLAHATETPPSFASVGADVWVPPAIEDVVQACLAKNPTHRPNSARDLSERYDTALAKEQAQLDREDPRGYATPAAGQAPYDPSANLENKPVALAVEDEHSVVHCLEAWMPEKIAKHKLCGFVHDVGGDVVESVPGKIRVRVGGKGTKYQAPNRNSLSWFGLGRKPEGIEVELLLQKSNAFNESVLHITCIFRSVDNDPSDRSWRKRTNAIYCDLRAYLMGSQ